MLLEARKLDKSFNGVYALKGLDHNLYQPKFPGPAWSPWEIRSVTAHFPE